MIKIIRHQETESYLKNDTVWDLKRTRKYEFKIFGLTIYSWQEDHKTDLKDNLTQIGFKK